MDIKRIVFDPSIVSKSVEQPAELSEEPIVNKSAGIAEISDSFETPTDKSEEIFDPESRYSGVLMQEGRVQLDSDLSEESVLVEFESGQLRNPVIIGNLWDSDTDPPETKPESDPDDRD